MFYTTYNGLVVPDVPLEETDILRSEAAKNNLELHGDSITRSITTARRLDRAGGRLQVPRRGVPGGRLTSLSLAAVKLNADFRAVANTLLQLSSVERLSLRGANVVASSASAATRSRSSTSPGMPCALADVAALASSCCLRLNLPVMNLIL
ncbi:hypothetical protein ZWY2020_025725 [Hordeum vulgare]|nr:hypothetical protein ZWY2020_025725 [Hordeum vulgare]